MERFKFVLKRRLPIFAELEKYERFVSGFNFFFPAVNRFDGWQNIRASRKFFGDELIRNPARGFSVGKRA